MALGRGLERIGLILGHAAEEDVDALESTDRFQVEAIIPDGEFLAERESDAEVT